MRSEIRDWVTLMTCDTYDAETGTFINRRVVRAVLIEVDE
jgi:sortase (surface protein transpeptidase)